MKQIFTFSILSLFFLRCETSAASHVKLVKAIDAAGISAGLPLVFSMHELHVDSAGGVSVSLDYRNTSAEAIKYLEITVVPFNAVGDRQESQIDGKSDAYLQVTGPIDSVRGIKEYPENMYLEPRRNRGGEFGQIWYNSTISCVKIKRIDITYMNGKKITIRDSGKIDSMVNSYESVLYQDEIQREMRKSALCKQ